MLKKITFFSGSLKMGGPQRVMVALSDKFVNAGSDIKFVTTVTNEVEYELDPKIEHIKVPKTSNIKPLKVIQKIIWLRKVLKEDKSDVIISFWHTVNMYLMVASLFLNKKIIISERNDPNNEPSNALLRKVRNFLYQFADKIVFQTNDAKEYYSKKIQNKSIIIQNPIRNDLPEKFNGIRRKEIVNYCRLAPQKNLFMLIDAFNLLYKEYPNYTLTIYGRGELKGQLLKYIQKLNLENIVTIKDFDIDIHNKIKDSAMFVSSSNYEGISNSMLEALAIGLPTICTDCPSGGARMNIKSYENGILVPVGDEIALYKAMKYIVENPEKANQMSKNAIEIKDLLDLNEIYSQWLNTVEEIKS